MRLTNTFEIERPATEVFDAFLDVERVATCIPGSRVLGHPEQDVYDGEVRVKVGPLGVSYTGQLRVLEADREQLRLTMRAKGREQRGAGNADAHVVATLADRDGRTVVDIDTELDVRGKVAQFGRGVISDVSADILRTFAGNLERLLVDGDGTAPAGGPQEARHTEAAASGAAHSSGTSAADADGLDVWQVLVRPMLRRHATSIATVALSGAAAYLGARAGARHGRRR